MKTILHLTLLTLLAAGELSAATHYVSLGSANPTPPYTNWATAASVIQDAVDAALPGEEIVVTNGVYATGGRAVGTNQLVNRVAVDKPLTLRSVNGPAHTIIQGHQVPGTTNGDGAIRCVYLGDSATLIGFTLTNGATLTNGTWNLDDGGGGGLWCDSTNCLVSDCLILGNSAVHGGGALLSRWSEQGCTLENCTLAGNSAAFGGGAYGGTLNHCTLSNNWAVDYGGGACEGTLNNCTLTGNSASYMGGGAQYARLNNCLLTGNWASQGGGAGDGWLNNCTVTGNSAADYGGGAAAHLGWGDAWCEMNNCIVCFNTAPRGANYGDVYTTLNYCCTTPLPAVGSGNIELDPQLASASHLGASSPCRGAGSAAFATGTDIDGEPWANPPSIGCDEYQAGAVTGPLNASIAATFTNVAVGYAVGLRALIEGRTSASVWDFGDGVTLTNEPYTSHAWSAPGDYSVALQACNEDQPQGVGATVTVHIVAQPVHYVAAGSANPMPPYTNWASAARNIQDAVDVATVPGALVLVTNGVYAAGGRAVGTNLLVNRVAVDKPLVVRSVNNPEFTIIQGYQVPGTTNGDNAVRCAYLANGAILSGFTLTNGATRSDGDYDHNADQSGGGVWCEHPAIVTNCLIVGNVAAWDGGGVYRGTVNHCTLSGNSAGHDGGGACGGTLNHCTLSGNSAGSAGGGACGGTLNHCTLSSNSAHYGGGASAHYGDCTLINCTLAGNSASTAGGASGFSTLINCIVYFNTAPDGPNYNYSTLLSYCCTWPLPTHGTGNITNAPLFVDYSNGNLRLLSNSPCINAGDNAYAATDTDLDGNPRIVGGTVDIGAYESQGAGSRISYAWLQSYGLPTDGSADFIDPDADGHTTWQEWRCQTCPTNALSALRLLSAMPAGADVAVTWQSVAGVQYFLERSTNMAAQPPFTLLAPDIPGQTNTTSFTDTNAAGWRSLFYRVRVRQ